MEREENLSECFVGPMWIGQQRKSRVLHARKEVCWQLQQTCEHGYLRVIADATGSGYEVRCKEEGSEGARVFSSWSLPRFSCIIAVRG